MGIGLTIENKTKGVNTTYYYIDRLVYFKRSSTALGGDVSNLQLGHYVSREHALNGYKPVSVQFLPLPRIPEGHSYDDYTFKQLCGMAYAELHEKPGWQDAVAVLEEGQTPGVAVPEPVEEEEQESEEPEEVE